MQLRPAISSMDTLFSDLWLDPATNGLLVYDATDVVIAKRKFLPDVAAIVLQIGMIETSLYSRNLSRASRFNRIVEHLKNFYPADHLVFAVASARHHLDAPRIIEFKVEDMPKRAAEINVEHTLYIPPVKEQTVVDNALFEQLTSADHLAKITVQPGSPLTPKPDLNSEEVQVLDREGENAIR
jgi:tetrapyrrole methylase family protein / MazG family protein